MVAIIGINFSMNQSNHSLYHTCVNILRSKQENLLNHEGIVLVDELAFNYKGTYCSAHFPWYSSCMFYSKGIQLSQGRHFVPQFEDFNLVSFPDTLISRSHYIHVHHSTIPVGHVDDFISQQLIKSISKYYYIHQL